MEKDQSGIGMAVWLVGVSDSGLLNLIFELELHLRTLF